MFSKFKNFWTVSGTSSNEMASSKRKSSRTFTNVFNLVLGSVRVQFSVAPGAQECFRIRLTSVSGSSKSLNFFKKTVFLHISQRLRSILQVFCKASSRTFPRFWKFRPFFQIQFVHHELVGLQKGDQVFVHEDDKSVLKQLPRVLFRHKLVRHLLVSFVPSLIKK